MRGQPPDFWADLILAAGAVWLLFVPLIAVSGLFEFFAWRRQRQVDRLYGKRR